MAKTPAPRKRTTKSARTGPQQIKRRANYIDHTVSIAMLQQQSETTDEHFNSLADKFDKILGRVEELATNSIGLNTRHDTQIQLLQQQQALGAEAILSRTREEITTMSNRLSEHVGKEISDAMKDMSNALESVNDKMEEQTKRMDEQFNGIDARLRAIEQWRMLLIGGGAVLGLFAKSIIDALKSLL